MSGSRPWTCVAEPEPFLEMVRELSRADRIAVDTESDSMYSYFEKVCLLQVATRDSSWLVDTLALREDMKALGRIFANPRIEKVLHGADYDIVSLKRDYGYRIRGVFDTMIAAQLLGKEKIGLADLVSEYFGDHLEKKHTRTNWGRRPLSESELLYSYLDVKYLLELSTRLDRELGRKDVREEALIEFRRLEQREPTPRSFDPDGYLRIRGASKQEEGGLAVLRELFIARDRRARRTDRPPFKVLANDTMLRICRARPRSFDELGALKGVTRYVLKSMGRTILKAVQRGMERGKPPPPRRKKPRSPRLRPRQQRQMDSLKSWRKDRAEERGVPTLAVLPNHAILEIVERAPSDRKGLAALSTVGAKRARLYGDEILEILNGRE